MGENTKTQKKSWFKGLKTEFRKIVWPDKNTLAKQTTAVVAASALLRAQISVVDALLRYGIDFLVKYHWYLPLPIRELVPTNPWYS